MGSYFSFDYMIKSMPILLSYIDVTLLVTVVAEIFGVFLGCCIALVRVHRIKGLNEVAGVYISFVRGRRFWYSCT